MEIVCWLSLLLTVGLNRLLLMNWQVTDPMPLGTALAAGGICLWRGASRARRLVPSAAHTFARAFQ
jgi:hypothetical protein